MDIKAVISQMTLEEKCSLLSGADFWHTKGVERLGVKPIMVSDGPHGLRKQDDQADHLGINDSIKAVCFPAACASTSSFDRELVKTIGETIGDQCQHERVAVNLGPAINIKRSPLCGRNFEYMSEDPYLAGEMAASIIQGIQSRNVGTSLKHFAANNQEHRRMSSSSEIDERTLREIYLAGFETAVKKAQPWTIMCSYNRINGVHSDVNKWLLTDVLRKEWGFEGYVVSDWGAVSDRVPGVLAGMDLEMPSSGGVNDREVLRAVREGRIAEADVDACVERILRINQKYHDNAKPDTPWDQEKDHELAGKLAAECMVLLKNERNVLPLRPGEKVAIIGEFAKKPRFQGGGSSHINCCRVTSLMDAAGEIPGVRYAQGYRIDSDLPDEKLQAEAVALAAESDKAVVVIGLPDSYESEGYDRTHMGLPENQNALAEAVAAANPNTVVLLYNGSPVEMPWADLAAGILEGYLAGQNVGTGNRMVLWGEVNPGARLAETIPMRLEDTPCYLSYGGEGNTAVYSEGVFVGYRYYDKKKIPVRFPFGFGLSYTTFEYSGLRLDKKEMKDTEVLTVSVDVTNTGKVPGKEVVQLYVADRESREVFRPVRELKGFDKISLAPGETKTVTFTLDKRAFAWWNTRIHDWYVESGEFDIQICRNASEVILQETVTVEGTAALPITVDEDTILMDLAKYPAKMAVMKMMNLQNPLAGPDGEDKAEKKEQTEAAAEAITEEMNNAMAQYSPLRNAISFTDGAVSHEDLKKLIDALNAV